jgi:hypothetical protein
MGPLAERRQPKTLQTAQLDSVVGRRLMGGGDVLRTALGHRHDVRATITSEKEGAGGGLPFGRDGHFGKEGTTPSLSIALRQTSLR